MDVFHIKKNKFRVIFILVLMMIAFGYRIVLAQNRIGVSLDKQEIEKGQTVVMTVDMNNLEIKGCTIEIYFDTTKLEYINETENSNFVENRVIYTWIDENFKERSTSKTENFKFKATQDGLASIVVTGNFYDKDGREVKMQDGAVEVEIGKETLITEDTEEDENQEQVDSSNANLRALRLDKEGISPEFQTDIKEYYFIADNTISSLQITAIPENDNAQVAVTGNTNLKMGLNTIKIQITSEDKTKKTEYKIHVTKTKNREFANANLENLAIKEGMLYPPFDANITRYHIEVGNDITNLTILAIPEKLKAKTIVSGGSNLKVGDNTMSVKVIAEDGITLKRYVITVHRRSEVEDTKVKQEQQKQTEQLSGILENKSEQEETEIQKQEREKEVGKSNTAVIRISVIVGIFVLGIIIFIFLCRKHKKK